ncbi:MAG: DUF4145 domain-containing protein [Candidatus Schekmanbacteria bacterium]|nr:DUF4145 domain-containing protein [Candidatus Schekmanbacteria bacterium]
MSEVFHWTCSFCNRDTTITKESFHSDFTDLIIPNADGSRRLQLLFIICPNPKCKKITLSVSLHILSKDQWNKPFADKCLNQWNLIPASLALAFPDYVPQSIINDYNEACLIRDTSPKASATLSRRCLQGIIRDFWKVKPSLLVDEIKQIKDKTDPLTWEAIDSVRKVGNIGAHMEKDINMIIDVDPNEAELLIGLIETLIRDWYVVREERKSRLLRIKEVAEHKDQVKKGTVKAP